MKKILFFLCLFVFCLSSCKQVNPNPSKGAEEFCAEIGLYAVSNDVDKANECLERYWNAYSDTEKFDEFCIALREKLRSSKYNSVGEFIGNIDTKKYPLFLDLMRHIIATSYALDTMALEKAVDIGKISMFDGFGEGYMTYDAESNEVKLHLITKGPIEGLQKTNRELAIDGLRIALSGNYHLLKLMTDAKASFSMWYSDNSQQYEVAKFSTSEIEEILNNPLSENERKDKLLENFVARTNSLLPQQIAEGVTYQKLEIKGNYVVQTYQIDDQLYDVNEVRQSFYSHKYDAVSDPIERNEYDIYVTHKKGLRVEYYNKQAKPVFKLEYTTDELKKILN